MLLSNVSPPLTVATEDNAMQFLTHEHYSGTGKSTSVYQKYGWSGQCLTLFVCSMGWLRMFWNEKPQYSYWFTCLCNCCVYILQIVHPTSLTSITRGIIVLKKSNLKKKPEIKVLQNSVLYNFNFLYVCIFFSFFVKCHYQSGPVAA